MRLLIILLVLVTVSTAARDVQLKGFADVKVDVNQICIRTRNPTYCHGLLNVPGISAANLFEVANDLLDQGVLKANDIRKELKKDLLPKATSAQKGHLQFCQKLYSDAYQGFGTASKLLVSGDYAGLYKEASIIATTANDCEDSFHSTPSTPSPLTKRNNDFFNLVDVLTAASYLLSHP